MNIMLVSIIFGMFSGAIFKVIDILKEHKKRLLRLEEYCFGKVISENEVDD